MINIICLKWGTKFSPEYVNRLYLGFKRNTTIPFKFHCFTDDPKGLHPEVVAQQLPKTGLTGWWNKLWLFNKDLPITGRVVYADLDTLIVRNVDDILSHDQGFAILRDLYTVEKNPKTHEAQSAFMSFEAHKYSHLWDTFYPRAKQIIAEYKNFGDQVWIYRNEKNLTFYQDLFPKQLVSYKVACLKGLPNEARIVCYHGAPSIQQSITEDITAQGRRCKPAPWVADYWRD